MVAVGALFGSHLLGFLSRANLWCNCTLPAHHLGFSLVVLSNRPFKLPPLPLIDDPSGPFLREGATARECQPSLWEGFRRVG